MVAESHRPGLLEAQEACVLQECLNKNQCFIFFYIGLQGEHQVVEGKMCSHAWAVRSPVSTLRCLARRCQRDTPDNCGAQKQESSLCVAILTLTGHSSLVAVLGRLHQKIQAL